MYSRVIFSRSSFLKVVVTINFPLLGPKRLYVSRLPTSSGGVAYHQTTLAVIRVHRTAQTFDVTCLVVNGTAIRSTLGGVKQASIFCPGTNHFHDQRDKGCLLKYNKFWLVQQVSVHVVLESLCREIAIFLQKTQYDIQLVTLD